jgi:hypothetical protein
VAAKYNFEIEQGATFVKTLQWKDSANTVIDLTGYTARMQLRYKIGDAVAVELTTENGGITINTTTDTISLNIDADDTEDLSPTCCKYDLELIKGEVVKRLLYGTVIISAEVTRPEVTV